MKTTISKSAFHDAFHSANRGNQFSYEGLNALYDWLEDFYDDNVGEDYELDVIGLCCEFTEYESFKELQKDYDVESMKELENNTIVIQLEGKEGFIIQSY